MSPKYRSSHFSLPLMAGAAPAPNEPRYDISHNAGAPTEEGQAAGGRRTVPTPRSVSSRGNRPLYIVAIAENRLKEVGFAAISVRGAELVLHQFVDSSTCTSPEMSVDWAPI